MTEELRRDISNGIWLCQKDGKLVDSDGGHFTATMLHQWKKKAERLSFEALVGLGSAGPVSVDGALDLAVRSSIGCLGLSADEHIEAVMARLLAASHADLVGFARAPGWPRHSVTLNLRVKEDGRAFHAAGLAAALEAFKEFTVVAPPGTGKTTTLLQVASAVNASARKAAIFIPLGEWSAQPSALLQSVLRRPAYAGLREQYLALAAYHGRLVLALDGWNELDSSSRRRATAEVRMLQREYPMLSVVVSTRRQALDVPIGGTTLEIDILNEEQQLELARGLRGRDGETLLDRAWRTPGVRDLITVPLYLTALLAHAPGGAMPNTKEEVLRLFVREHEEKADKALALHEALFGFHPQMLVALATDATHAANTAISDTKARAVVSRICSELSAAGQITTPPQPSFVLDVLVSQHTLVRSSAGTVSFQHQQFQEWYASFEAEHAMCEASSDSVAWRRLRAAYLDQRSWEEPILFACERLSRASKAGADIVSELVLSCLSVDPMLAAEMIFRSSPSVWEHVREQVLAFVTRWHRPGKVDRAVRFMVLTGRSDFAERIWPLVENPDTQVYLSVLRAARRFRPEVLGANPAARLAAIPEATRKHVLGELAIHGSIDAMDLAARVAKDDPSPEVIIEVIESLRFRRADRHASAVLTTAPKEVWTSLAKKGYASEIAYADAASRLRIEWQALLEQEQDPMTRVSMILQTGGVGAVCNDKIGRAIEEADFSGDQHGNATLYQAFARYPKEVALALVRRLNAGREMPFGAEEMLAEVPPSDDEAVAAAALDVSSKTPRGHIAASITGPATVRKMLDALVADQSTGGGYHPLRDRVAASPVPSFVEAMLARIAADRPDLIGLFASLIAHHGSDNSRKQRLTGDQGFVTQLVQCLHGWTVTLLAAPDATRVQMAYLATAIGRVGCPSLLPDLEQLLKEDLHRRAAAQAAHRAAPSAATTGLRSDAATSWTLQYREAFSRIDGDSVVSVMKGYLENEEFGFDAACVLGAISERGRVVQREDFFKRWPDLSTVREARTARRRGDTTAASPLAEMIFEAITRLIGPGTNDAQQRLAIMLGRIAFSFPQENQASLVGSLLAVPQPVRTKRELLAALVLNGEVVPSGLVLDGVRAWIEDARENTWRFRDGIWEIEGWLELLPFTDRPASILEGVDLVYDALPDRVRMERLVSSVSYAPCKADELVSQLLERYPELAGAHEWMTAFLRPANVAAILKLFERVSDGRLRNLRDFSEAHWLSRKIAALAHSLPELRLELLRLCRQGGIETRQIIERTLSEIADAECVRELVRGYARDGKAFDGQLHQALRHAAHDERPAEGWVGATSMHPRPLTALRKELFGMMEGSPNEARLAAACLEHIDSLRDDYGAAEFEPRHPDVETRRPWPREAPMDQPYAAA